MNAKALPNVERDYRFFLWFLTLVTVGMYVYVLATTPGTRQPLIFVPATLLITVSISLHWFNHKIVERPRMLLAYILFQGVLAFIIVLLCKNIGMIFALFMAMFGECIGMMGLSMRGLLACAYYLALSLASYMAVIGSERIGLWLLGTVPVILFIAIFVTLYNRQAKANDRARILLSELETANRQLSEYAAQVEDLTIAAERQRMARELHDTLSQGLAGLVLQLEAADAHLAHDHPGKARQIVQKTMEQARDILAKARQAIDGLRRDALLSLEETLHKEIERFMAASGLPCAFEIDLQDEIPPERGDAIIHIIPEALSNTLQHAGASRAWLKILNNEKGLIVEMGDDGAGFDPALVPSGHYGLIGMRERARLAGGNLEIKSRPGGGTHLILHFPVEREKRS